MLVDQFIRLADPLLEAAREDFPWRHFIGESGAGSPPQQCLDLLGGSDSANTSTRWVSTGT